MTEPQPPPMRRVAILDAATEAFGRGGYRATRVADVARRAGLSKGAVYWHFPAKAALLTAAVHRLVAELEGTWDQVPLHDPRAALIAGLDARLALLLRRPDARGLLRAATELEAGAAAVTALRSRDRDVLAMLLARIAPSGTADRRGLVRRAQGLLALVDGLIEGADQPEAPDARAVWAETAGAVMAAVARGVPSGAPGTGTGGRAQGR